MTEAAQPIKSNATTDCFDFNHLTDLSAISNIMALIRQYHLLTDSFIGTDQTCWSFRLASSAQHEVVTLEHQQHQLAISIDGYTGEYRELPDWRLFDSPERELLWACQYEAVMTALQQLSGYNWLPATTVKGNPTSTTLAWHCQHDHFVANGHIAVTQEFIQQLNHNCQKRQTTPSAFSDIVCYFGAQLFIRSQAIPMKIMRTLIAGDVVILGESRKLIRHAELYLENLHACGYFDSELNTLTLTQTISLKGTNMDAMEKNDLTEIADELAIHLDIRLATLKLPYQELKKMSSGYVLELDKLTDDTTVQLCLNGKVIAQGNLVRLNNQLGLQLTHISPNSSSNGL